MTGPRFDLDLFRQLAAEGKTRAEIAAAVGICTEYAGIFARRHGIKVRHASAQRNDTRETRMESMFRAGVAMADIGRQFNLTRERVRQILERRGLTGEHCGGAIRTQQKKAMRDAAKDARYMLEYGHPYAVVKELRKARITHAFRQQRANALRRGIEWKLTFAQWFAVWQTSGHLDARGKGIGSYCMSRIRDDGAYALGNVHIESCVQNSRDALTKWVGKTKPNRGVFCLYPGREKAWFAKVGKTSLGYYATEQEAVAAREAFFAANPDRHPLGRGRGYSICHDAKRNTTRYQVIVKGKYIGTFKTPEEALAARASHLSPLTPEGA